MKRVPRERNGWKWTSWKQSWKRRRNRKRRRTLLGKKLSSQTSSRKTANGATRRSSRCRQFSRSKQTGMYADVVQAEDEDSQVSPVTWRYQWTCLILARGGSISRLPFHPANIASRSATSSPAQSSPLNTSVTKSEDSSTQPAAEALLESESVKVKLPGSEEADATPDTMVNGSAGSKPQSSSMASASGPSTAIRAQAPAFVQPTPIPVVQPFITAVYSDGTASPQPFPAPGSENGSISSNGHFVPTHTIVAPGVAITPSGDYYNVASGPQSEFHPAMPAQQRQFYPGRSFSQQQSQAFYPQSFSPDMFQHPSRHGSFSSQQGYTEGRASPFPPVFVPGQPFFAPPRPSKVSIKAPTADEKAVESDDGLKRYPSIDQARNGDMHAQNGQAYYNQQGYNPYAAQAMGYGTPAYGMNNGWVAGGGYANGGGDGYGYDYGY